jgi:hypothetical protein
MHNQEGINVVVFCYLVREGKKIWSVYILLKYRIVCSNMTAMYSVVQHGLFKDDFNFSNNKLRLIELVLDGKSLSYLKLFLFFHYGLHWQKEKFSKYSLKVILHMMSCLVYLFHSCCLVSQAHFNSDSCLSIEIVEISYVFRIYVNIYFRPFVKLYKNSEVGLLLLMWSLNCRFRHVNWWTQKSQQISSFSEPQRLQFSYNVSIQNQWNAFHLQCHTVTEVNERSLTSI